VERIVLRRLVVTENAVTQTGVCGQALRYERRDVLHEQTKRAIVRAVGKARANVDDIREVTRRVAEIEILSRRSNSFVVELGAERNGVIAFHARGRLRLVAVSACQVELVSDTRTQTLRVVDALRTAIVALSVEGENGGDRVEWSGAGAIVTRGEEVENL